MFRVGFILIGLGAIIYGVVSIFTGADLYSILAPIIGGIIAISWATRG